MKICVVGAGGMGSVYGGRLAAAGQDVCLVDVYAEHVERISSAGLVVEGGAGTIRSRPRATTELREAGPADLTLVFVKSMQTAEVARGLAETLGAEGMVLTLQNGYGNVETLAEALGPERILAGVSYRSAELLGPGWVREDGIEAETILGPLSGGETPFVRDVVAAFNAAGIRTRSTENPRGEMWGKLVVNCAGNAIGAILDLDIGSVVRNAAAMQLVDLVIDEVVRLAGDRGITLPYPDAHEKVRSGWMPLIGAKASTHQDIHRGRPTEIDALNGAIVRESEREGLEAPYNRAVTLLIKALEEKRRQAPA